MCLLCVCVCVGACVCKVMDDFVADICRKNTNTCIHVDIHNQLDIKAPY